MRDPDDFDEPDFGQHRTLLSPLHPDHIAPTNTEAQEHTLWRREQRAAAAEFKAEMRVELRRERV